MQVFKKHAYTPLPGFSLSLGITLLYLSLIVLLPLSMIFVKLGSSNIDEIWKTISSPRVLSAFRLSFSAAFAAALINLIFGTLLAWVLVRYRFPFRRLCDALVDLPFALPTAVAGIALTAVYVPNGWLGSLLVPFGISVAFTQLGVLIALVFVGLPFVVRTVQPVLEDFKLEIEEASATLGASRLQTFCKVILPALWPSMLTGFSLAFARALGEYGSVVFISGNMPSKTEVVPLLIMTRLEAFDFVGATAISALMLLCSFVLMLAINFYQLRKEVRTVV